MAKVLVTEQYLTDIADAIRAKLGVSDTYTPAQMAGAIATISGGTVLVDNPSYFIAETIDTAQKIAALQNAHTFTALFVTDTHAYTSSNNMQYVDAQLASLNAVAKTINPDLVIHGGDMTNGSEAKATTIGEMRHIIDQMREIGGTDTHILMGNHDGNTVQGSGMSQDEVEANRITESEFAAMCRSWDDGFTYAGDNYQGGNLYGYRDYPSLDLRVIRLHSYQQVIGNADYNGGKGGNWGYYADEVTWFTNVALDTDRTILIVCHQSLSPVLQGYAESQDIPHRGMQLQQAIDAWLDASPTHRCAGVVHGHVHWDYSAKGKGTFEVIDHSTKQTITRTGSHGNFYEHGLCLANYLTSFPATDAAPTSSYRDVPAGAIVRGRAAGTVTQGLWTAVVVDTDAQTVNLVRFGAGTDATYEYSVPKVNLLPLATESDGTSIYPTVSHSSLSTVGYAAGYRLNSAGVESAMSGKYVTGFIPVSQGKTVRFENMGINGTTQDNNYISFYDSSHKMLWSRYAYTWIAQTGDVVSPHTTEDGVITSITLSGGSHSGTTYDFSRAAYMRVSCNLIDGSSAIYVE